MDVFLAASEAIAEGRAAVLATVIGAYGSTPRKSGARLLIYGDGQTVGSIGGGELEQRVKAIAQRALSTGDAQRYRTTDDLTLGGCAGDMEIYIEPLSVRPQLYLFGSGHVAHATVPLLTQIGFGVHVIDDRAELLTEGRFPGVNRHLQNPIAFAAGLAGGENVYFVLMTHEHSRDGQLLEVLLGKPYRWIGMLSSSRKMAHITAGLRDRGISEEQLRSVHAPIGLDIGASNPSEIAVSIAAQLVAEKNRG